MKNSEIKDENPKKKNQKEATIFLAIIILFPALMIYLELAGVDTDAAFINLLGYILIGTFLLGISALILIIVLQIVGFLIGK